MGAIFSWFQMLKPSKIFIPLNFILSLSTMLLTWGVRIRKDKHNGFCSDPWGADWYVLWFISSLFFGASLVYTFIRGKKFNKTLGDCDGSMFVFTCVFTFVLFVMGFLYFSTPDKTCDSLQVFDSILWALGLIGAIVLRMSYPNRQTMEVIPELRHKDDTDPTRRGYKINVQENNAKFKNLRY
jgi:hypothetical protein